MSFRCRRRRKLVRKHRHDRRRKDGRIIGRAPRRTRAARKGTPPPPLSLSFVRQRLPNARRHHRCLRPVRPATVGDISEGNAHLISGCHLALSVWSENDEDTLLELTADRRGFRKRRARSGMGELSIKPGWVQTFKKRPARRVQGTGNREPTAHPRNQIS